MRVRTLAAPVALTILLPTLVACTGSSSSQVQTADPSELPTGIGPTATPTQSRLVGIGHVAVAVPDRWGTNRVRCGTPQMDTVVIDQGVVEACLTPRPAGVDSATLEPGKPFGFQPDQTVQISGVTAQRQDTTCSRKEYGPGVVCSGAIYVPSEDVSIEVASSTDAAVVETILEQVKVLPDLVAVPGFVTVAMAAQERSGHRYLRVLQQSGLQAQIRYVTNTDWPSGFVVDVSPSSGTMVDPGSTVTVKVAR